MQNRSIAILDFGSQYTHLIRRAITELGVTAHVCSPDTELSVLQDHAGIIISGGPSSVHEPGAPRVDEEIFQLGVPVLGICYGHQLMAHMLDGLVTRGSQAEYGRATLAVDQSSQLFHGLNSTEQVWMSHGDDVEEPPRGFSIVASTEGCAVAAMENPTDRLYGIQFHPEVEHTVNGTRMLSNFVVNACQCKPHLSLEMQVDALLEEIRKDVGEKRVFLLVSGGIDSTVAFLLLSKALGSEHVYGLHINTGLLREGETARTTALMARLGLDNFHVVDATEQFLSALTGLTEPEAKRKAVARTFLAVKDQEMKALGLNSDEWLLGQGTIYPDLIASGVTTHSHTIKTHHNSLLSERTSLRLVEPLSMYYKDEVRKIGTLLGLPEDFVWQEPFPGPGVSVRILGEITPAKIELQRKADTIMEQILRPTPWFRRVWHRFPVLAVASEHDILALADHVLGTPTPERVKVAEACQNILMEILQEDGAEFDSAEALLLPLRTVGIKGDARSYEAPAAISVRRDGRVVPLPHSTLEKISTRITNSVVGVNRLVYDLTPPHTDANDVLVFLRLITSRDAMTADWARIEFDLLESIAHKIVIECSADRVFLDATQKPPSMMEWE